MTFDVDSGGPIPESGTEGTVTFSVSVNDECTIEDLDAHIVLEHTFISDLDILLKSPLGTEILLFDQRGGSGEDLLFTLFDDEAANPISVGIAPFTGSFRPAQPLSNFDNENPNGIWTLTVVDNFAGDSGILYKTGDAFLGGSPGTQLIFNGDATCLIPVGCGEKTVLDSNNLCVPVLLTICGDGTIADDILFLCNADNTALDVALATITDLQFQLDQALAAVPNALAQRDAILTTLFEFLRVFGVIPTSCPIGETMCSDTCVDTSTDVNHCGACNSVCALGNICVNGQCQSTCIPSTEVCDGIDNDCDSLVDEGVLINFYQDADGDTFGNDAALTQACFSPGAGFVTDNTDCDDSNAQVNPAATEILGDGLDNDCDGTADPVDIFGTWAITPTLVARCTATINTVIPLSVDGTFTMSELTLSQVGSEILFSSEVGTTFPALSFFTFPIEIGTAPFITHPNFATSGGEGSISGTFTGPTTFDGIVSIPVTSQNLNAAGFNIDLDCDAINSKAFTATK